jgi:hypothetical protein
MVLFLFLAMSLYRTWGFQRWEGQGPTLLQVSIFFVRRRSQSDGTGAASGIGAATARRLAAEGATFVLDDINAESV